MKKQRQPRGENKGRNKRRELGRAEALKYVTGSTDSLLETFTWQHLIINSKKEKQKAAFPCLQILACRNSCKLSNINDRKDIQYKDSQ